MAVGLWHHVYSPAGSIMHTQLHTYANERVNIHLESVFTLITVRSPAGTLQISSLFWFQFGVWVHHTLASSAYQHPVVRVFASLVAAVWCSHKAQHLAVACHCQRRVYRSYFTRELCIVVFEQFVVYNNVVYTVLAARILNIKLLVPAVSNRKPKSKPTTNSNTVHNQ